MGAGPSQTCPDLEAGIHEDPIKKKLLEEKRLFLVCKSIPLPPTGLPGALPTEATKEIKGTVNGGKNNLELKEKLAQGQDAEVSKDNLFLAKSDDLSTVTEADIRKIDADSTISHVEKAVKFAKQAVIEDNKANYVMASQLYSLAVKCFVRALIVETSRPLVRQIQEKMTVYIKRSVRVKSYLLARKISLGTTANTDFDSLEEPVVDQIKSAILKDKPDIKWTNVAGLEDAIELLKETLILPIKFPQLFTSNRRPWKGILLYGLRGTGKTFLAKAAAAEATSHTVFSMKPSNLMVKWLGESEKLPNHLFDMARKLKPSIIFIDEVDSLSSNDPRGNPSMESVQRMVKEFMLNLKGMDSNSDGILVLGATSSPWKLDDDVLNLFEKKIYIPLPDENARLSILKRCFSNFPHTLSDDDFKCLAEKTNGYSGEDVTILAKDASLTPLRKVQKATHFVKVSGPSRSDPSVTVDDLYMPCSESHPSSKEINLMDIPGDKLLEPKVTLDDVLFSLENSKPADKQEDIIKMKEFMESIGQKSSDTN